MSALSTQFGGMAHTSDQEVTEAYGIVLGPIDVQNYSTLGFYIHNKGADDVASLKLWTAPVETGPWIEVDELLSANVIADAGAYAVKADQALKFIRLEAECGAGDATVVDVWVCASRYGL